MSNILNWGGMTGSTMDNIEETYEKDAGMTMCAQYVNYQTVVYECLLHGTPLEDKYNAIMRIQSDLSFVEWMEDSKEQVHRIIMEYKLTKFVDNDIE